MEDSVRPISSRTRRDIENEITSGSWDAIRGRLLSSKATRSFRAAYRNENGVNAFHLLCANNDAPSDVVRSMIATDETYLTLKTRHPSTNATALHFAAETGSASTIKILLDEMCKVTPWNGHHMGPDMMRAGIPGSWQDAHGRTPLDILLQSRLCPKYVTYNDEVSADSITELLKAIDKISCYKDMSAEMQDLWEKTTCFVYAALTGSSQLQSFSGGKQWFIIHEIVKNAGKKETSFPREVLWLAIKLYPGLLGVRDENGDLPIHLAMKSPLSRSISALWFLHEAKIIDLIEEEDKELKRICSACNKSEVRMLLQAYPKGASMKDSSGRLPLQILCESLLDANFFKKNRSTFSAMDIEELLKADPAASLTPNREGDLPLHILCKNLCECFNRCENHIGDQRKEDFRDLPSYCFRDIIMKIISFSRHAATVRNRTGRLPLHLLLDGGSPLKVGFVFEIGINWRLLPDTAMVDAMVELAPETLDTPDGKSRLLPFMMAAVGKNSSVDCIYSLLRKSPANVRSGITKTSYEEYLEQKVEAMEKVEAMAKESQHRIQCLEAEIANLLPKEKKRKLRRSKRLAERNEEEAVGASD